MKISAMYMKQMEEFVRYAMDIGVFETGRNGGGSSVKAGMTRIGRRGTDDFSNIASRSVASSVSKRRFSSDGGDN